MTNSENDGYPATPGYPRTPGKLPTAANTVAIKCNGCNNVIHLEPGFHVFWPIECTVCHRVFAGQHYARLPEPTAEQIVAGIGALEAYASNPKGVA